MNTFGFPSQLDLDDRQMFGKVSAQIPEVPCWAVNSVVTPIYSTLRRKAGEHGVGSGINETAVSINTLNATVFFDALELSRCARPCVAFSLRLPVKYFKSKF